MRAYSQEVRQQVLRAVDEGISRAQIIERFQVSPATIKRYLKQRRETGNVLPRPIPGRPPRKKAALRVGVQELLQAHPEARKPRVLSVVGGGVWHPCEPSFNEPGHPCAWLDAQKRQGARGDTCHKGRVVVRAQAVQAGLGAERVGAARTTRANSAAA